MTESWPLWWGFPVSSHSRLADHIPGPEAESLSIYCSPGPFPGDSLEYEVNEQGPFTVLLLPWLGQSMLPRAAASGVTWRMGTTTDARIGAWGALISSVQGTKIMKSFQGILVCSQV